MVQSGLFPIVLFSSDTIAFNFMELSKTNIDKKIKGSPVKTPVPERLNFLVLLGFGTT